MSTDVSNRTRSAASAQAVAIQPDGRIIAAGWQIGGPSSLRLGGMVIVRYTANGALDPSFAGDGSTSVVIDVDDPIARAEDMVIQPDGRIVAVGWAAAGTRFAVARFNPDGSLDTTFDENGLTVIGVNLGAAEATVRRSDGRIIAAGGAATDATFSDRTFALAQYDANGALDPGFGSGGAVTTDFGGPADDARAVVLRPDGRIVASGMTTRSGGATDFALAGYNPDGTPDRTFGQGGQVTTDLGSAQDAGNGAVLQPDNRIVLAGTASDNFALARYNPNGTLDTTFGQAGKVVTDFANATDRGLAVALQADGRIIVAGSSGNDFALARYNPNGTLDTTFGS